MTTVPDLDSVPLKLYIFSLLVHYFTRVEIEDLKIIIRSIKIEIKIYNYKR